MSPHLGPLIFSPLIRSNFVRRVGLALFPGYGDPLPSIRAGTRCQYGKMSMNTVDGRRAFSRGLGSQNVLGESRD